MIEINVNGVRIVVGEKEPAAITIAPTFSIDRSCDRQAVLDIVKRELHEGRRRVIDLIERGEA